MKTYIVDPTFEMYGTDDDRTSAAISLIVEVVFTALRAGGDTFQYAVAWANPGEGPGGIWNADIAEPHVYSLEDDNALRAWLRKSVDPNVTGGGDVRSIATCRTATFGYDGQVMLLLRHEDQTPISPEPLLAVVEDRPDLLVGTDYFDGWMRGEAGPRNDR